MSLGHRRPRHGVAATLTLIVMSALLVLSSQAQAASTGTMTLNVVSARNGGAGVHAGDPITTYKYIINVDNTGTTSPKSPLAGSACDPTTPGFVDPLAPAHCPWTSIAGVPGSSPIATQGDQTDFAGPLSLPAGRYVISVLADGFKLDGAHLTVPDGGNVPVTVELQPTPIPDATVRALVFQDNAPVNSAPDLPAEQGLAGFEGQLTDYLGQIITDVYGNPLCTTYVGENPDTHEIPAGALDPNGVPVVATPGGHCLSDASGMLAIPHMGTNRYALSVIPPNGTNWVQTTTLEGNHDWDSWVMEGNTGYDTEFVTAGEPVPTAVFGFVKPTALAGSATGEIKGVVDAMKIYVPAVGGLASTGQIWGGLNGGKIDKPIDRPWIALTDLLNGDQAVYVGRGNADGTFDIKNVPNGNYTITWWDDAQNYILDLENVTVSGGQVEDLGILPLQEWWTQFEGHVFNDLNSNGKRDPGEPGVKDMTVAIKKRENSGMDRGNIGVTTAADGSFSMENVYPMTQWLVMEVYSDRYYTTGVTYQADNQPNETTVLGAGVDVSVLPIIGLSGRIDWGVKPYPAGKNGGIVGTVSYDTTRNELDPRFAAVEPWQPGIPDLPVNLYAPVVCGTHAGTPCATTPAGDQYELATDGAYAHGQLLNQYTTENWKRPGADNNANGDGNCVPRNVDGNPLAFGADQLVTTSPTDCLEGPLMGVQFQQGFSTVDGNYGFGDGCFGPGGYDTNTHACADGTEPTALSPDDYIVDVGIPNDARGKPLYKVTREEDINIGNGDQTVPQIPPPPCVGTLHTVDVAGVGTDGYGPVTTPEGITVPASTPTDNPTFVDIQGSIYEGQQTPLCDQKLVHVSDGRSIAPTFNLFTDVPVPARFWGLLVDDLNFSADKKSLLYGEKAGIPNAPVGIYDYTNRLVTTSESDFNGLFDVLLPSTNRINCPTPSGVCANLYRFVGNDPGVPGKLNANYRPDFRTIAAEFEGFPGLLIPADLAPTQVGVTVQLPGGQTNQVSCVLDQATPQLMAVSKPYVDLRVPGDTTFVIKGQGFGAGGSVTLDNATVLPTSAWSDTQISVSVPAATAPGAHQLNVTAANGQKTVNGLTFHVLGGSYTPNVYEVGPGKTYAPANSLPATADHAIQRAIDAAAASSGNDLVVVYPGLATADNPRQNPRGAYYENLIITKPLKLQGVGPGGIQTATNTTVPGSIIDGSAFGGDSPVATDWQARIAGLQWDGNQNVNDGAVISIYAQSNAFPLTPSFAAAIDGLDIRGGDQQGFPTNINQTGGGPTGLPAAIVTQGGAVFANAYARALRITNNVVQNNGGGYGTIRIGTPDLPAPNTNNHNENLVIAQNRVIDNAGTNLAGGIGVFAGADNYEIAGNDVCGNFSAEYGGGISAYGLSPNGKIHNNRIYFNRSYDEGGGIMIAGELPATPGALSPGSGPVTIEGNQIQDNLANDDGGGIRFLMAGNFPINVRNNMIVNNVSTHEGGGVALDDAPDVRFVNNTVMKNITTATAVTSNGLPAPAGLSTGANSTQLQATLPAGSPTFSRPMLFNNIFWDNRAGTRAGDTVTGIGVAGDASPVNHWDLGAADGSGLLTPTNSVLQVTTGTVLSPSNSLSDPNVVATYDTSVDFASWRTNPNFVGAILVATDLPPNLLGNYHLKNNTSPAYNGGAASKTVASLTVAAPTTDYDGQPRPSFGAFDIGADEIAGPPADLAITKTDGRTSVSAGSQVSYTITVRNNGPNAATGATVTDTVPAGTAGLANVTWTCTATGGSSCGAASGSGNAITTTVSLVNSGSATITVTGTFGSATSGTLSNTATVTAPPAVSDPNLANNTATDSDSIVPAADLRITKSDGVTTPAFGSVVTYTVVVSNLGPAAVTGAIVNDAVPTGLTNVTWTCTPTGSGSTRCLTGSGTGSIGNRSVNIASGGQVTFTVTGTVATTGTLANTATVAAPSGTIELDPTNNSATDTDTVPLPALTLPSLGVLDAFNRANANTLGAGWNQSVSGGSAAIRVNGNQAFGNSQGQALWSTSFGSTQGAAFDLANASSPALILKATGGSTNSPSNYIVVSYDNVAHTVSVSTTTNAGGTLTQRASFAVTLAVSDTLSAIAYDNGSVSVWKNGQLVGVVRIPTSGSGAWTQGTGGGRIGIRLPAGSRIDNFRGGTLSVIAPASANLMLLGSRVLQLGMRGPDVNRLQTILHNYGFAMTINGAFGRTTQQAVKTLQRRFRLRATGTVDKALVRRLGSGPRLGSRSLRLGMRGSDVKQLQHGLRTRGHAVTINGSFGPRTRRAVMAQQQRFGLRATGVANGTFLKRLAK